MALVSVLMVVAAMICFWDVLPWLASPFPAEAMRFAPAAGAAAITLLTISSAYSSFGHFRSGMPLGLEGAQLLRLQPDLVSALHRLETEAKSCSMLVTMPGLPSFNMLSGRPMPTGMGGGPWMIGMDETAQAAAVRELESQPRPCAIYYPDATRMWMLGGQPADRPLVHYILNDLQLKFEASGYRFLVKSPTSVGSLRPLSPSFTPSN
jgi:hypothetical protein